MGNYDSFLNSFCRGQIFLFLYIEIKGLKVEFHMRGWRKCRETSFQVQMMAWVLSSFFQEKKSFISRNILDHWSWEEVEKGGLKASLVGLMNHFFLTLALVQFIYMFRQIETGLEGFVSRPPDPSLASPTSFAGQATVLRLSGPATCATGTSWHSYKWLLGVLGTYPSLLPLHFFFF